MSRLRPSRLMVLAIVLSACGGSDATAELVVPESIVVTDAVVERWGRPGECDGAVGLDQAVRTIAGVGEWVLVDNRTGLEYFDAARLDAAGDMRIPAEAINQVLTGDAAPLGVAIDSELFDEVGEVLAAGGDLILPSIAVDRENQIAEPQTGFLAVLPDGRAAWVGACGRSVTEPLNAYLTQNGADDRATILALYSADEAVVADYEAWYAAWSTAGAEPEAWENRPPDSRSVDIEDTPPDVLARLGEVQVLIVIPDEWAAWDAAVCGKSDLGWLGCANALTGTTSFPVLVEPGRGFVLTLLDGSARFSSRMEDVASIEATTVDKLIDTDQVLVFTPDREFIDLGDLRAAAARNPAFTYEVMALDEAMDKYLPTEPATTDTTVP